MIENKLLQLERMSHAEKVQYWSQGSPWKVDGTTLRLPKAKAFQPGAVEIDGRGNITQMPLLLYRPCFGQVSAFLRHGGNELVFNPRNGGYHKGRCARCEVADACVYVCEERLDASKEIKQLYREWRHLGGRASTWPKAGKGGSARTAIPYLLSAIRNMNFTSVNDARVQAHYEHAIEEQRIKERDRKRRDRERQLLALARRGEMTPETTKVLEANRILRMNRFRIAAASAEAPLQLRKAHETTAEFDSYVWLAATRIKLRGARPNPSKCATELHELGYCRGHPHNNLRVKVKRSLDRITLMESLLMPNGDRQPVSPAFNLKVLKEGLAIYTLQQEARSLANAPAPSALQNPVPVGVATFEPLKHLAENL